MRSLGWDAKPLMDNVAAEWLCSSSYVTTDVYKDMRMTPPPAVCRQQRLVVVLSTVVALFGVARARSPAHPAECHVRANWQTRCV
jgi:hypothetical protein